MHYHTMPKMTGPDWFERDRIDHSTKAIDHSPPWHHWPCSTHEGRCTSLPWRRGLGACTDAIWNAALVVDDFLWLLRYVSYLFCNPFWNPLNEQNWFFKKNGISWSDQCFGRGSPNLRLIHGLSSRILIGLGFIGKYRSKRSPESTCAGLFSKVPSLILQRMSNPSSISLIVVGTCGTWPQPTWLRRNRGRSSGQFFWNQKAPVNKVCLKKHVGSWFFWASRLGSPTTKFITHKVA